MPTLSVPAPQVGPPPMPAEVVAAGGAVLALAGVVVTGNLVTGIRRAGRPAPEAS